MPYFLYLLLAIALIAGCGERPANRFTVEPMKTPAGAESAEAHLARGADGTVVMSWLQRERDGVTLRYSVLAENDWQAAHTIASGDDWFVNWADFPSVIPMTPSLWAAHWLVKRPGGKYAYDVAIAMSRDAGQSWSEPVTPHTDGTLTEHGFVSLFPWHAGIGALWLDGRNMVEDGSDTATAGEWSGMTLRAAVIAPDQTLADAQLVDDLVCDCCQTDVALGPSGPIAVYRNRTTEEIRDIYVSRAIDGRWQHGQPIGNDGWKIAGCPVNGPAIAADGSNVAVAWFTATEDTPRVRLAYSSDGAETFGKPVEVDAQQPLGRADVTARIDAMTLLSPAR